MAIKIILQNIDQARAAIAIATRRETKSPLLVVLTELVRLAENGEVTQASTLHNHFLKEFNIKQSKFNKIMAELTKAEIIEREKNIITFCPELSETTNTILITSKII